MNKVLIVALVLLLAGLAMSISPSGLFSSLAGDNSSCGMKENCTGNCSVNCSENCSKSCISPNNAARANNNSSQQSCSALGPCPVKAFKEKGRFAGR